MNYKTQWNSKALPDHRVSDRHQITQPPRTLQKKKIHETSSTPDHSLALPLQQGQHTHLSVTFSFTYNTGSPSKFFFFPDHSPLLIPNK